MPRRTKTTESSLPVHFANDRSLPAADRNDLLAWVKAGIPEGDPSDAPLARRFRDDWAIGEPDFVAQIPRAFDIKATGQMPYKHAVVKTDFEDDRWVQAVEIQPTDRTVVHHVLVFVQDGNKRINEDAGFFAAYVPGNTFQQYPAGMAKRIPRRQPACVSTALHARRHGNNRSNPLGHRVRRQAAGTCNSQRGNFQPQNFNPAGRRQP